MSKKETAEVLSPMPFGWGANPNPLGLRMGRMGRGKVTNAFRLGG